MNRLYRISALALAAALCLALAACGPKLPGTNSGSSSAVSTPAASGSGSVSGSASVSSGGAGDTMSEGQRYAYAIRDARPAEDNEYSEIACGDAGGEPMLAVNPNDMSAEDAASSIQMMLDTMGTDPATLDAYAFSMSMMNVRAYAIGVSSQPKARPKPCRLRWKAMFRCSASRLKTIWPTSTRLPRAR